MTYNTVRRSDPSKGLSAKALSTKGDRFVVADEAAANQGKYVEGRNAQTRDISGAASAERTGFPLVSRVPMGSTLAFDNPTRTFSITPTGASFTIWSEDLEHTISTPQSVVITDTEGLWYFYFDFTGTLQATQLFSTSFFLGPDVFVSYGYWDAVNKEMVLDIFDERHGLQMDGASHLHWHEYIGATYRSGFALNNLQVDQGPPVNDDAYAQFGVDSGVFNDEDLRFTASAVLSTTGLPILYLEGAGGVRLRATAEAGFSVQTDVTAGVGATGRLVYNDIATGTRVVVPDNDFVLCHVFVTGANTDAKRIYAVMGQATYINKNDAEEGANTEIANLKQLLPVAEFLPIATVIFQTGNTATNAVRARVVSTDSGDDYVDWRFAGVAQGTGASPADHNLLSNRSDPNSHPASAVTNDETALDNFLAFVAAAAATNVQDLIDQIDALGLSGAAKTWRFTGVLTPAQLTASVDDYAPAGYDAVTTLRLDADAAWDITGLVPPTDDSYLYILQNVGANNITLKNEDVASTAANRFALTDDFVLAPEAQAIIVYDAVSNRWRLVGGGGGSSSSGQTLSYGFYDLSASQSTGLTDTSPIQFDQTLAGDIVLNPATHRFTLKAGRTYKLWADCRADFSGNTGQAIYVWYDDTNSAELGKFGVSKSYSTTANIRTVGPAEAVVTPETDIEVYLRFRGAPTALNGISNDSRAYIYQLGATGLGQPDLYSETETKLPGQWWQDPNNLNDYYPYYVKKVPLGALPNAGSKTVAHGITNAHLDSVEVSGHCDDGTSNFPLPHAWPNTTSPIGLAADTTNIYIQTGTDRTSHTGYAYVKYAKTTDTPVTRDEAYGNGGAGFPTWITFTPVTNWTAGISVSGRYKYLGDELDFDIRIEITGAIAPTGTPLTVDLLSGFLLDLLVAATDTGEYVFGQVTSDGPSGNYVGIVSNIGTDVDKVMLTYSEDFSGAIRARGIEHNAPFSFNVGDTIHARFKVPVKGA